MSKFQNDLTEGSVTKQLLKFSMPFLLSNLLQALYNMADMLIVGLYSPGIGTTAVGIGGQVTILLINLISGLAIGSTVLIAQFIGARRSKDVEKTIGTMFTMYAIVGAVMTVVMLLLSRPILTLMQTPADAFEAAADYLMICMGGTLFVCGYNAVSAVLRGMGNSRHPLIFVAIAAGINVVLDFALVGGLHMGAAGAAWATIIAQAISFLMSVVFLRRRDFVFDFHPRSFRMDKQLAWQIIRIGFPSSLQGTLVSFSFMALTTIANTVAGLVGSTALSIAGKVNSIAILPSLAMQASVASMAGQNIGAGKPQRAQKTMLVAIAIAFSVSAAVFAVVNLFPEQIVGVFLGSSSSDGLSEEVLAACVTQGAEYLRAISWDYLLTSVLFCINGLAIGVGHTLYTLISASISSLIIRIPAAYIMGIALGWGLGGVGYAAPTASLISLLVSIVYFFTGAWKRAKIRALREPAVE